MMVKEERKEFNHNLMIVGIVGVVAIIGILITLSTGAYTGQTYNGNMESSRHFHIYQDCVDIYGTNSGCGSNTEFVQSVKDWCSCRTYDGQTMDSEPTVNTPIDNSNQRYRVECGERPICDTSLFGGRITGKATGAGIESVKVSNIKEFVSCLNRFGNVQNYDAFTRDAYKADYSQVPAELVSWCGCRFADVLPNFHNGNVQAMLADPANFYGEASNEPLKEECGPNPITGE